MPYVYVKPDQETGAPGGYYDTDTGQMSATPPAGVQRQTMADNPALYSDGSPRYFDPNNANDLANARQNYKELMAHPEWSDQQAKDYIANATTSYGGKWQFGSNAPGLTSKVDNKKQWYDTAAPLIIGGLATAGASGLFGAGDALANVGAGATEFGGEFAGQGGSYLSQGGGALDFAGSAGGGDAGSLAETGGSSSYAPDAPGNMPGGQVPNGTGMDAFGNMPGDPGYDPTTAHAANMPGYDPGASIPQPTISNLGAAPGSQATQPGSQLPPGAQSVLSKLLSGGSLTSDDIAKLVGAGGTTLAGLFGADATRSANNSAADKMLALGAPARAEFNRTIQPGFDPSTMPGYTSAIDSVMNSYLRKASTGGNPFTDPGVSMEANKYVTDSTALPALNNYRNTLVNAGNTGVGGSYGPNQAAASAPNQATNAVAGGLGSLSAQPAQDYSQVLKQILNLGQAVV